MSTRFGENIVFPIKKKKIYKQFWRGCGGGFEEAPVWGGDCFY